MQDVRRQQKFFACGKITMNREIIFTKKDRSKNELTKKGAMHLTKKKEPKKHPKKNI